MEHYYKRALDKIKLDESEKNRAKALFCQASEKKERSHRSMGRLIKPAAAFAAVLALILLANSVHAYFGGSPGRLSGAGDSSDHFTITAYAKKLTKTGQVYAQQSESGEGGVSGSKEEGTISFAFWFPLECSGKDIDTITYTIQNGAFQITTPAGKSLVVSGEELQDPIEAGVSYRTIEQEGEEFHVSHYDTRQYRSFTVNYDEQGNDETCIEIVDASERWEPEKIRQYQAFDYDIGSPKSIELQKEVYDFLTKDLGISCTATFRDGTTQTKNIAVSNKIVTMSELLDAELSPEDDFSMVVRCFSLQ
ncbi:MAG: hypothetical protein K2N87_01730 [Eubacterium sp.]|nr:hypothetical protein [Eubacterium sp.]